MEATELTPTWTVVQFVVDGTVEAVPSTWIQGDMCHWPSFPATKIISSIRKSEPLNTCWPAHKVEIFRNATFEDYMTARNKARLAEDTSDLNTGDGANENKRRRIPKIISSEESSDSEDILPSPPKIKRTLKVKHDKLNTTINSNTVRDTFEINKEDGFINMLQEEPTTSSDVRTQCYNCKEKDKNFKTIIQQNHVLRSLLTDTLSEVKEIKILLHKTEALKASPEVKGSTFFKIEGIHFPINTDGELEHLENLLENAEEFKKGVIELSKLGGANVYDIVKRIFTLTLSNEQTLKYSWLGRKGKKPFQNLNLAKLVLKAVEHSGLGTSQKQAEIAIQTWLRRASDRRTSLLKKF